MYCFCFPLVSLFFFFFNDTATTEIYTLSLHDALPISWSFRACTSWGWKITRYPACARRRRIGRRRSRRRGRSEEHTSELQSLAYIVCRLLLAKKKTVATIKPNGSTLNSLTEHYTLNDN